MGVILILLVIGGFFLFRALTQGGPSSRTISDAGTPFYFDSSATDNHSPDHRHHHDSDCGHDSGTSDGGGGCDGGGSGGD